ncbi:MAG: MFS transporter [Myxococcales bacterium]|nr:MFS transporter [Myxococcales bacterium]
MRDRIFTAPFVLLTTAHLLQSFGYASLILMPLYLDHLGASRTQVGTVIGSAAIGGLAARPLVGWALDRVGRKPTLAVGTLLVVAGMLGIGAVVRIGPWVYGVHVVIGIGLATLFTAYFTAAADLVPPSRRTEGLALFGISGLVPLVINPMAELVGITGADLRWFFPGIGLVCAAAYLCVIPIRALEGSAAPAGPRWRWRVVSSALRHRALWSVWLATTVFSAMVAVFMAYATVVAADRGVAHPANLWFAYAGGAVTVRLLGARLPDAIGPSRMIPPALLLYVSALALCAQASSAGTFLSAGLLAGLGHGFAFPVLTSQVVSRTADALRGSAMSLFTALWDLVKLLLVPLAGLLADARSDAQMLQTAAALATLGLLGWALLERRAPTTRAMPRQAAAPPSLGSGR